MSAPDFIDECRVFVRSGDGGRGCCSFRREKFVPRGGPDGGNGGKGGSVHLVADRSLATLLDTRHRKFFRAGRGAHGSGARKDGKWGDDVEIRVPLGTVVKDDETHAVLVELLEDGQTWLAEEGGRGGRGNAMFATSTNQAPLTVEPGEEGRERWLRLELKILADVGLIGFPNAGKSTLISRVSAARPKVAGYPFTTLHPHLGMVASGGARFVIADIPGLIPGAHRGAGLGHRFLRHVERTRLLVHLLDPQPCLAGGDLSRSPELDYDALRAELAAYSEDLAKRTEIVCIAKADLVPDPAERALLAEGLTRRGLEPRWISAATGEGVESLLQALAREVGRK
jgi:GTP-binding protein